MFKRLKGTIGKIDEQKSSNTLPQNRPTWSGFSTISPINSEMEDSQFCINDDIEETPKNSPARVAVSESTTIDLGKFSQSSSSLVNDHVSFNTDIESASELDDSVSVVSEYASEITKESLYAAYKKLHGRYHKHKIKYTELANKFKHTVTTHDKDKITMTKAQDKLLQRIAELKEQCTLEQAAKAHMEDALRNDIEERDHIISTLNTKIDLLRTNNSEEYESIPSINSDNLLNKCERLNEELSSTKLECASLEKQIELLKKSEESTLLSLAENKMAIHKELETKEDQIKKLEKTINGLQMENKLLLKEKAGHTSSNSYQVNINQNVQEEITKQLNEIEGEMSSAFEFKENEVKELKNQLKILEQRFELQKQKQLTTEETLNNKEKEIKDFKLVISRLEQDLNDDKVSASKKIDTFLKEIGEKSQIIKNLTIKVKEVEKHKQDCEKNENYITDLKNQISQTKKIMKENELIRVDEQNRCIAELKLKSEKVSNLNEELQLLRCTIDEKEKQLLDFQNYIDDINLKNNSLKEADEKLKLELLEYKKINEELQESIKLIGNEKNNITETLKIKMEEFEKLNKSHKEMLSQLNQEKLNKISEERSIESVIKDYNLLTEENAYLKKERQKTLQIIQDLLKKFKTDFENLKSFAKEQLADWSLVFVKQITQLKAEYSIQIKLYQDNLIVTTGKLEEIQNAYAMLKSDCIQSLESFKTEVIVKCNEDILVQLFQNNEELEKSKIDLLKLQEEIDHYKMSEKRSVKAEVKETIQELQECIEIQKKTFTDLQNEYSNYQITEKKKWTDKLTETENKWLEKMDNYKKMMDTEHREELEALTNEWTNERKLNAQLENAECKNDEALEKIIQDAETTSQREDSLQRQITKLTKELSELKKMYRNEVHSKLRSKDGDDDNDKDGCEMEYLRNILYEYMMGKQPMVLAKVLAAIVKFDSNQLNTILQKEEQKVSLLKTLGL